LNQKVDRNLLAINKNGELVDNNQIKEGVLTVNGQGFEIKTNNGSQLFKVDNSGNAFVKGTLTVDRLIAGKIDGLELITNRIADLEARLKSQEELESTKSAVLSAHSDSLASQSAALIALKEQIDLRIASASTEQTPGSVDESSLSGLFVDGSMATISGNITAESLHVKDSVLIESVLNVVDMITSSRLIIADAAQFIGRAIFKSEVEFQKAPVFSSNTAGSIIVKKGEKQAEIRFEEALFDTPSISLTPVIDELERKDKEAEFDYKSRQERFENMLIAQDVKYSVVKRNKDGFSIKLSKEAPEDMKFSWTAIVSKSFKEVSQR
jgi:hypothetical protein